MEFVLDDVAPVEQLPSVVLLEQPLQLLQMGQIIDFTNIAVVYVVPVIKSSFDFAYQCLLELLVDLFVDIYMVHSHAGLSAVDVLPEHNSLHCALYFGRLIHDHWALPSQLQNARRQIPGGLNGHKSASLRRAREADDVELHLGEGFCHFDPTFDHLVKP